MMDLNICFFGVNGLFVNSLLINKAITVNRLN